MSDSAGIWSYPTHPRLTRVAAPMPAGKPLRCSTRRNALRQSASASSCIVASAPGRMKSGSAKTPLVASRRRPSRTNSSAMAASVSATGYRSRSTMPAMSVLDIRRINLAIRVAGRTSPWRESGPLPVQAQRCRPNHDALRCRREWNGIGVGRANEGPARLRLGPTRRVVRSRERGYRARMDNRGPSARCGLEARAPRGAPPKT